MMECDRAIIPAYANVADISGPYRQVGASAKPHLRMHQRARHVPYGDSKLSLLLRESLGGNSRTCIISTSACGISLRPLIHIPLIHLLISACGRSLFMTLSTYFFAHVVTVPPYALNHGIAQPVNGGRMCEAETRSTLQFALRAKSVKNRFA